MKAKIAAAMVTALAVFVLSGCSGTVALDKQETALGITYAVPSTYTASENSYESSDSVIRLYSSPSGDANMSVQRRG